MKTLYLECGMGCAGDMLMAALSELVDRHAFVKKMNALDLPGIHVEAVPSVKCGINGTYMKISIHGQQEHSHDVTKTDAEFSFLLQGCSEKETAQIRDKVSLIDNISSVEIKDNILSYVYDHDHGHTAENQVREVIQSVNSLIHVKSLGHTHHEDHHHNHGMHMHDIREIIQKLDVSDTVKKDALAVYGLIQQAESSVHHMPAENIHFHEVGTLDAIADVVGSCILFEMIGADRIYVSPVATGSGMVRCAHGILPVPAPATAYLLQGIPTYAGRMQGELCTPTGAALLKYFADSFEKQPVMVTEKIGYGMGYKDFEAANCVRAFLGSSEDDGEVVELVCTIDDQTGEEIGYAIDRLLAEGALDVYTTPVHMKKNRPGIVITCTVRTDQKDRILQLMFRHLTTLGIREYKCRRHPLNRDMEILHTDLGDVRLKHSYGFGIEKEKAEYEDLAEIAQRNDMSISEVRNIVMKGGRK